MGLWPHAATLPAAALRFVYGAILDRQANLAFQPCLEHPDPYAGAYWGCHNKILQRNGVTLTTKLYFIVPKTEAGLPDCSR